MAANQNCPEDILKVLTRDKTVSVRAAAYINPQTPFNVISDEKNNLSNYLRCVIALNSKVPEVLRYLAVDNKNVWGMLVFNPVTPTDVLQVLAEEGSRIVGGKFDFDGDAKIKKEFLAMNFNWKIMDGMLFFNSKIPANVPQLVTDNKEKWQREIYGFEIERALHTALSDENYYSFKSTRQLYDLIENHSNTSEDTKKFILNAKLEAEHSNSEYSAKNDWNLGVFYLGCKISSPFILRSCANIHLQF